MKLKLKFNVSWFLALGFGFQQHPYNTFKDITCRDSLVVEQRILRPTPFRGSRPDIDPFVWTPFEAYREMTRKYATHGYSFEAADMFSPMFNRLIKKIEAVQIGKIFAGKKRHAAAMRRFQQALIEEGQYLEKNGIPYDRFISFTRSFTLFMTARISTTRVGQLHRVKFTAKEIEAHAEEVGRKTFREIMGETNITDDIPFFLLPTDHRLIEMDFLRTRGVPVYFLGTESEMIVGDQQVFTPYEYWNHDLVDHAKGLLAQDRAMFSAPNFNFAGPMGLRSINGRWSRFLDQVDAMGNETEQSGLIDFLFYRFHEQNRAISQVPRVLKDSVESGVFPEELKDYPVYDLPQSEP